MKACTALIRKFNRQSLKRRLMIFFAVLITFPVTVITQQMIRIYQRDMIASASQQMLSALEMAAQQVSQQMYTIEEATSQMMLDKSMAQFFSSGELSAADLYKNSAKITSTMAGYLRHGSIDTLMLYTPERVLGYLTSQESHSLTPEQFEGSKIHEALEEADYALRWIPTFDLAEMYGLEHLKARESTRKYRTIFSAVRRLNFMYIENSIVYMMPAEAMRPVLVINFPVNAFRAWIGDGISYPQVRYQIAASGGIMVYDSMDILDMHLIEEARPYLSVGSAYATIRAEDGARHLLCAAPIGAVGWTLIATVPMDEVIGTSTQSARALMLSWLGLTLALALMVAYLIARGVTRPVSALLDGVKRVSRGDFDVRIEVPSDAEFQKLTEAFNDMGGEITSLIHENYEIYLKETQAQLSALNLQLNPHFLYNTLNVMNLMAMESGHSEMTDMIEALSGLLHYVLAVNGEQVELSQELEWLRNYLRIMDMRYEGMFTVAYDVAPEHMCIRVPKLILQPIVENCFMHGKIGVLPGARIRVASSVQGEVLTLAVEDNGAGMDVDAVYVQMISQEKGGHIGLNNTYRRLRLIYGADAHVSLENLKSGGSRVALHIPIGRSRDKNC